MASTLFIMDSPEIKPSADKLRAEPAKTHGSKSSSPGSSSSSAFCGDTHNSGSTGPDHQIKIEPKEMTEMAQVSQVQSINQQFQHAQRQNAAPMATHPNNLPMNLPPMFASLPIRHPYFSRLPLPNFNFLPGFSMKVSKFPEYIKVQSAM